jgi:Uma2 family endonuclease
MVAARENLSRFTPEEYFAWKEQQLCRHEYSNGEVYAMSGRTQNHSDIAGNFLILLKTHLRGVAVKHLILTLELILSNQLIMYIQILVLRVTREIRQLLNTLLTPA